MNILWFSIFVLFLVVEFGWIHASINGNTVLKYINKKRRSHGCHPLDMDLTLSRDCKDFAKHIAKTNDFSHSEASNKNYTENICKFLVKSTDPTRVCVEYWYNGNKFSLSDSRAREFSAMIWRSSERMGYGEAMISATEAVMVVRYTPPGNVPGIVMYNVPPKLDTRIRERRDSDAVERQSGEEETTKRRRKKRKRRKRRRNSAIRHASLNLFTVLFLSYWSVRI